MRCISQNLARMIEIKGLLNSLISEPETQNLPEYSSEDKIQMRQNILNILAYDDGILKDENKSNFMLRSERLRRIENVGKVRTFIRERLCFELARSILIDDLDSANINIKINIDRMKELYKEFTILTFNRIIELLPKSNLMDNLSQALSNFSEQYEKDNNYTKFKNTTQEIHNSQLQLLANS